MGAYRQRENLVPSNIGRSTAFVKLFSSAIITQGLLSATNLFVGLVLIRRTNDFEYGTYVLVSNALALLTLMQTAYIQPPLVTRMAQADRTGRADLIGGLYREQRRALPLLAVLLAAAAAVFWATGLFATRMAIVVFVAIAAAVCTLYREFFRIVLLAYRRPFDVLKSDLFYVVIVCVGVMLATLSPMPAATAVSGVALATGVAGVVSSRVLWRHEAWNLAGAPGIFRTIAYVGGWSLAGAAIHWAFSQGYNYVVAATLDVTAVASIAATRLLMMPVNLVSSGIATMILPTASGWLQQHSPAKVLRRMVLFSSGLAGLSICYFAVVWLLRDWIFLEILKKNFAHRDMLLLLWSAVFLVIVFRDQMVTFVVVRSRLRALSTLTLVSAVTSLLISYFAMLKLGVAGALCGVLIGEMLNLSGIIFISLRERDAAPPVVAAKTQNM